MPLTPNQLYKIQQKEASTPEAYRRDTLTGYFEGFFHVTLNVREEAPLLGIVCGSINAAPDSPDAPHVELTDLGKAVEATWRSVPSYHPSVQLLAFQAMPEHIHCLLHLKPGGKEHLGRIINGFMIGCTHAYWDTLSIPWRKAQSPNNAAASPKYQDRDHTRSFRGPALFTHGYNDVEAITPEQIQIKIDYIRSNPERRLIKGTLHDIFTIHRQQTSRNWTMERVRNAICADRFFASNPADCEAAKQAVSKRLNADMHHGEISDDTKLFLEYIGDKSILHSENKVSLVCHRKDAIHFECQKARVLEAARKGAVVVSAFISPKEREIRDELMREQLPMIIVADNGFSNRYKPFGTSFYACAEKRLVQISPWNYLYQKKTSVTREMCLVMNELTRIISGKDDDWWKQK